MSITRVDTVRCDLEICKVEQSFSGKFPYDHGWLYLYNLNTQVPVLTGREVAVKRVECKDKHFCCLEHKLKFIESLIKENMGEAYEHS